MKVKMFLTFHSEKEGNNSLTTKAKKESTPLRPLYLRSIIANFGSGLVGPYINVYVVQLGASATEMGWFRSLGNLFSNVMQVPWGIASDRAKKRVPFIILGSILSSLLWLPMIYVRTAQELIVLVVAQAFISSMVAPAWSALIGDMAPHSDRGSATATINAAASLGSVTATLISGYIMISISGTLSQMYMIPLVLAAIFGFGASLTMLTLRERMEISPQSWTGWSSSFKTNSYFRTFCLISIVHGFFMAVAWPLFSITQVKVIRADMVQIAYLSVIAGLVSIVVGRFVGRLADRSGRKSLIVVGRAGIFAVPAIYAVATNVYHLYAVEFVIGILSVAAEIAVFAYMLDIVPKEHRAASIAFFNTIYGLSTFLGSLLGGYLTDLIIYMGFEEGAALQFVYGVSAAGRLAVGLLFTKIREPYKYPSTAKKELMQMMLEDTEHAKKKLKEIDERGQIVEDEVQKDYEWFENTLRWRRDKERQ